jgi:predicted transcriptional regulator of viral defense system
MSIAIPTATKGRLRLSQVLQQAGDLVTVGDVSRALQLERPEAAKLLARWRSQGLLKRLRQGVYAPVPITALGQDQVLEDPWLVVPELFGPAYNRRVERGRALGPDRAAVSERLCRHDARGA